MRLVSNTAALWDEEAPLTARMTSLAGHIARSADPQIASLLPAVLDLLGDIHVYEKEYHGGRIPYGYKLHNGSVVPDPYEQNAIKIARALREKGLSLRAIGTALENMGFRARAGWWHPTQLGRMIRGNTWAD
jgi:hypothetical protein